MYIPSSTVVNITPYFWATSSRSLTYQQGANLMDGLASFTFTYLQRTHGFNRIISN
jgi:hypothetical protein